MRKLKKLPFKMASNNKITQSCPTVCNTMECSTPGFPVTNSQSLHKLMSVKLVMWSNHLILCHPLLLPSIFPASGSFPTSQFFASGSQSIGAAASVSVLPMSIQDWFPLGLTGLMEVNHKKKKKKSKKN